ncbi:MAG: M23 family metallopeptidase [Ignavibacteriae bacterium]|jgi:murein DD-endopeptidase MepM/ murein hydrolase activator NlpD|nr:M23 family metallopeptidase [Ignavibacteriota bacterium]
MEKKYTTITVVSSDDAESRYLTIPSVHVKRWKMYATVFIIFISACLLSVILLSIGIISSGMEIGRLNTSVIKLKNDVKLIDSLNIRNKVGNIEKNINDINRYLFDRGVFRNNSAGGPADSSAKIDLSIYDYYDKHTEILLKSIKITPVGVPFTGELKSDYGYRNNPFSGRGSEFHKGIDIKGSTGDPVKCTASGIVEKAEYEGGYGKSVVIKHASGYITIFGHLSAYGVKPGQEVKAGDVIGYIGSTGRSTGPHLHYEIHKEETDVNPQNFLTLK